MAHWRHFIGWLVLPIILILTTPSWAQSSPTNKTPAIRLKEEADALAAQGKFLEALDRYREARARAVRDGDNPYLTGELTGQNT